MTEQKTPFSQQLAHMAKGSIDAALTDDMADLVKAINDFGKSGSITLKLELKPERGSSGEVVMIDVKPDISVKLPKPDMIGQRMWPTVDGDLLRHDPDQQTLDLTTVPKGEQQQPVRVDTDG